MAVKTWIQRSGVGASGGNSGGGGAGTPAPNLLGATVGVAYKPWAHRSVFGFTGSISSGNLPSSDPAFSELKQIVIYAISPASQEVEIGRFSAPFTAPLNFDGGYSADVFLQAVAPDPGSTWSVKFVCLNSAGEPSASPYTVTGITVDPASITSVDSAGEAAASRYQDSGGGLHFVVQFTPVMAHSQSYTITVWTDPGDGSGPRWRGWWDAVSGTKILIGAQNTPSEAQVWVPTAGAQNWKVICAVGSIDQAAAVPAGAVSSSIFTVNPPKIFSDSAANNATFSGVLYVPISADLFGWGWNALSVTLPYDDPEFFYARFTIQKVDASGNAAPDAEGPERPFTDDTPLGQKLTRQGNRITISNPGEWTVPPSELSDGSPNPYKHFRFKIYVASRYDTTGSGGTEKLQACWPGGQTYLDVVVESNSAVTATAPPNISAATVAPVYEVTNNQNTVRIAGTISLPTTDPRYSYLTEINISSTVNNVTSTVTYAAPFVGTSLAFTFPAVQRLYVDTPYSISITTANGVGVNGSTPLLKTATAKALGIDTVGANERNAGNSRFKDPNGGLHTTVDFSVNTTTTIYPIIVTVWTDDGSGAGPRWRGWWVAGNNGTLSVGAPGADDQYQVWVPTTANQTWSVTCEPGAFGDNVLPGAHAKTSAGFLVLIPAAPPASGTGSAQNASFSGVKYVDASDGNFRWGWDTLSVVLPYDFSNFFFARLTIQKCDVSGNPAPDAEGVNDPGYLGHAFTDAGPETPLGPYNTRSGNTFTNTNPGYWTVPQANYGDGSPNPYTYYRFRIYVGSRGNLDGSGGSVTLQKCWPGGADNLQVQVSNKLANYSPTSTIPVVSSIVGFESSSPRYQDLNGGLHTAIKFVVTATAYPIVFTLWTNDGTGINQPLWRGWFTATSANQTLSLGEKGSQSEGDVWVPTTGNQNWVVIADNGKINSNVAPSGTAKTSGSFPVQAPPPPPQSGVGAASNASFSGVTYLPKGGGVNMWGWVALQVTLPYTDPNFFYARFTIKKVNSSGSAAPDAEGADAGGLTGHAFTDDTPLGQYMSRSGNVLTITNPNLWDVPSPIQADNTPNPYIYYEFRIYIGSRFDPNSQGGTSTLQNCWPGGVNFLRVLVDGVSKGKVDGRAVDSIGNIPGNFTQTQTNNLQSGMNIGSIPGSFSNTQITTIQGGLNIGSIPGSFSNTQITTIQGGLNIGSIPGSFSNTQISSIQGGLNIGSIPGSFTQTQINSIAGGINVGTLSGTFTQSQINQIAGGINVGSLTGSFNQTQINQIAGGISVGTLSGSFTQNQINQIAGGMNIGTLTGSFSQTQVNQITSLNIGSFSGAIISQQVADGLIQKLSQFNSQFAIPQRMTSLPSLPNSSFPNGSLVLITTTAPSGGGTIGSIQNPGFDTGGMFPWVGLSGTEFVEGTSGFAHNPPFYCRLNSYSNSGVQQTNLSVSSGTSVTVAAYVTCLSVNAGNIGIFIDWYSNGAFVSTSPGSSLFYTQCLTTNTSFPNWQRVSATGNAPSNANSFGIRISVSGGNGSGWFYCDDTSATGTSSGGGGNQNTGLYINNGGAWQQTSSSTNLTGFLTQNDIISVNAGTINGVLLAGQCSVQAGCINGTIQGSNVTVDASRLTGTIAAGVINNLDASVITTGTFSAGRIGSINSTSITINGSITTTSTTDTAGLSVAYFTNSALCTFLNPFGIYIQNSSGNGMARFGQTGANNGVMSLYNSHPNLIVSFDSGQEQFAFLHSDWNGLAWNSSTFFVADGLNHKVSIIGCRLQIGQAVANWDPTPYLQFMNASFVLPTRSLQAWVPVLQQNGGTLYLPLYL